MKRLDKDIELGNRAAKLIREYFNTPKWRQIKKDRKEQDGRIYR